MKNRPKQIKRKVSRLENFNEDLKSKTQETGSDEENL